MLAQKSDSLSIFKLSLTLLHARLSHWQRNVKFSRSLLKRSTSFFDIPSPISVSLIQLQHTQPAPFLLYTAHLAAVEFALTLNPPDVSHALVSCKELRSAAEAREAVPVVLLAHVLQLRVLVDTGMWDCVGDTLSQVERYLGLSYGDASTAASGSATASSPMGDSPQLRKSIDGNKVLQKETDFVAFEDAFEAAMAVHALIMGVVYYTHVGAAHGASARLSHLHALLDGDVLSMFPEGIVEVFSFVATSKYEWVLMTYTSG